MLKAVMFTGNRKLITIYSLSFVNVQQLLCCEQRPRKIIFRRLCGGDATLCRITVDIRCAPQVGPLTTYAKTQCPVPGPNRCSRTGKLKGWFLNQIEGQGLASSNPRQAQGLASSRTRQAQGLVPRPDTSSRSGKLKDTASSRAGSLTRHNLKVWQSQGHGKLKGWFLDQIQITDLQTGEKCESICAKTQCLCTHLTSFGGDMYVPPNTIDFNTVCRLTDRALSVVDLSIYWSPLACWCPCFAPFHRWMFVYFAPPPLLARGCQ